MKRIESEKVFLSDTKNLKAFINALNADEKYSFLNRYNLTQPIHMNLSQKRTFSRISFAFLKSILNLEHFQKKDDPHS